MKNFLSLVLILFSIQLSAQDTLLQHIDHDNRHTHISSMFPYNGGMVYALRNDGSPITRIMYLDQNQELQLLYKHEYFEHLDVEYYINESGILEMYIYGLFDYDLSIGSIYQLLFDGENVEFNDINHWDYFDYVSDVERMHSGDLAVFVGTHFFMISSEGELNLVHENLPYYRGLFKDDADQLYFYHENECYNIDPGGVEVLVEFDEDIQEIEHIQGSEFLIVTESKLYFFADEFQTLNRVIDLPEDYRFESGIEYTADFVYLNLIDNQEIHSLWKLDNLDNLLMVQKEQSISYQNRFVFYNDNTCYLGGDYLTVKPSALIREIDLFNESQHAYIDISMDEFTLYAEADSSVHILGQGDTIVHYFYHYSYDFTLTNHGEEALHNIDVYSNNFYGAFDFKQFFTAQINDGLLPGESKTYTGFFELGFSFIASSQDLIFYVPGADYKLDADYSDNQITVTNIISSNENESKIDKKLICYPNPVREILFIDPSFQFSNQARFQIYDMNSSLITEGQISGKQINLKDVAQGAYVLRVVDGTNHSTQLVIKQ